MRLPKITWRRVHAWTLTLLTLPILLISVTGVALHLKKQLSWIQPPEMKGSGKPSLLKLDDVLAASRQVKEARVTGWDDVARVDIRPAKSLVKVVTHEHWEIQLDAADGSLLSSAPRSSDWLEALHDGSWFHGAIRFGLFLGSGLALIFGSLTGLYLFLQPLAAKRRRRRAAESHQAVLASAPQRS